MAQNVKLTFTVVCKKCGEDINIRQPDTLGNLGYFEIPICRTCVKNKAIKLIQAKQDQFNEIYDAIEEELLNEE